MSGRGQPREARAATACAASSSTPRRPASAGAATTFDWPLAAEVRRALAPSSWRAASRPRTWPRPSARCGPGRVDVASGVESSPGVKDPEKLAPLHRARAQGDRTEHHSCPTPQGRFGAYGGRFVPETLMPALDELEAAWRAARADPAFQRELDALLPRFAGRPTPLGDALPDERRGRRLPGACSSARTSATPARTRSTTRSARCCWPGAWARGASSPRPAPASTAWPPPPPRALFGLPCEVFMGALDVERQALNVFRMQLLGARVVPVEAGLAHAQGRDERGHPRLGHQRPRHPLHHRLGGRARTPTRRWCATSRRSSASEARAQVLELRGPAARRGGGLRGRRLERHGDVQRLHRRPGGRGSSASRRPGYGLDTGKHGATLAQGRPGVLHGSRSYVLQDDDGPDRGGALDQRRPRLPRRRAGARLPQGRGAARAHAGHRRRGARRAAVPGPHGGDHPGAGERPRGRGARGSSRASSGRAGLLLVNVSGRGDKDVEQVRQALAARLLRSRSGRQGRRPPARPRSRRGRTGSAAMSARWRPCSDDRIASMFEAARARGEARARHLPHGGRSRPGHLQGGGARLRRRRGRPHRDRDALLRPDRRRARPSSAPPSARWRAGTTLADCARGGRARAARSTCRLALMGYVNPVLAYGLERFFRTRHGVRRRRASSCPTCPRRRRPRCGAAADCGGREGGLPARPDLDPARGRGRLPRPRPASSTSSR